MIFSKHAKADVCRETYPAKEAYPVHKPEDKPYPVEDKPAYPTLTHVSFSISSQLQRLLTILTVLRPSQANLRCRGCLS